MGTAKEAMKTFVVSKDLNMAIEAISACMASRVYAACRLRVQVGAGKRGHCKGGSENICCVSDSEEEPSKSSSSGETFDVSDSEEEPSKSSSSRETFDFPKTESKEEKAYNSLTAKPSIVRTTRPPEKRRKKGGGIRSKTTWRMGQSEWLMGQNTIVAKWLMGQNTIVAKWFKAPRWQGMEWRQGNRR